MSVVKDAGPVTVAHDYFTQRGGAERVAAALVEAFSPTRIVTSVHSPSKTFVLATRRRVETTFLQRISFFRHDPRRALPILPVAWRLLGPVSEGVLICSSSGWSHALRAQGRTRKIVYCHNPARWLYQPDDFFKDQPLIVRMLMRLLRPLLVRWDRSAAHSADIYIANSTAVAERIRRVYGIDPVVLHPPISINASGAQRQVAGVAPGYFAAVSRGRGYKNIDHLLAAFRLLPHERLLVVGTPASTTGTPENVQFVSNLSDEELRWVYANATALTSVSHEDFGLTPLEANALGTPALVLRAGGFLDSVDDGVSGMFIDSTEPASIAAAIRSFPRQWNSSNIKRHAEKFSKAAFIDRLDKLIEDLVDAVPSSATKDLPGV